MRTDCEVIKDLLPLYVEQMASDKSIELIEEHLAECNDCKKIYEEMNAPEPELKVQQEEGERFKKFMKKWKHKTILVVLGAMFLELLILSVCMGALYFSATMSPIEEYTDIENYNEYMGEQAKEEFRNKCGMDETIFPEEITTDMRVKAYKMVYYNPWDAQYLSYLTVEYDKEDYGQELQRLEKYNSTDYIGDYGVTGFAGEGNPLAIYADGSHGFVYAMKTLEEECTITYVELIFCNYFFDLDYTKYIPKEYLPENFDATQDNAYRKKMLD